MSLADVPHGNDDGGSSFVDTVLLEDAPPPPRDDHSNRDNRILPLSEFPPVESFEEHLMYPALRVPVRETAKFKRQFKQYLLGPKLKNVYLDPERPEVRILVFRRDMDDKFSQMAKACEIAGEASLCEHRVSLGYEDLSVEDILKRILPVKEIPSAFEIIGHIAHLNLRDESLPYKYWVGKVILEKNKPRIQTVVNKVGTIDNEYRTFGMEVIAGKGEPGWSKVIVREEGCNFELDFQKVYWNSRLSGEHKRLVDLIKNEATRRQVVVADLMAGVGPFAVPLTSQNTSALLVYANDKNPVSYEYLLKNSVRNKCVNLVCANHDARYYAQKLQNDAVMIDHVIMNLPASAPEFLDAFSVYNESLPLPRFHVHCFAPKESKSTDYQDAVDRCSQALGHSIDRIRDQVHIHVVRDVSPAKNMLCVSFILPESTQISSQSSKRSKINEA